MKLDVKYLVGAICAISSNTFERTAAEWLALRECGLSAEKQVEFDRWLLSDERRAEAFRRIEYAWGIMQKALSAGRVASIEMEIERLVEKGIRSRRRKVVGCSLVSLATAAALIWAFLPKPVASQDLTPSSGGSVRIHPESKLLSDGSIIELNAGADVAVNFTVRERDVRLVRGEAHFKVAKNATRPFVVAAGALAVRAVGTEFDVRLDPKSVDVLVTEGKVAVGAIVPAALDSNHASVAEPIVIAAGNRLTVPDGESPSAHLRVESIAQADIKRVTAWRNMRVEFTGTSLREVVDMFNRENQVQLILRDGSTGQIRISGIFWADDPEGFSRLIEASAGLKAARDSYNRIVLSRQ